MRAVLTAIAGLAALAVAHPAEHNAPRRTEFGCGTEPTEEFLAAAVEMAEQEAAGNISSISAQALVIPTYFHLVTAQAGEITDAQLSQQLQVMNSNYAPYGISFNLLGTDKTVNSQWANDQAELTMKRALRKGDYKTLNVYFQTSLGGNLGYCYFPTTGATAGSTTLIRDGCAVLAQSVPGGTATNFNQGKTATHEIGHWFGLFHTFQGGCSGAGDSVADTPAQASPSSGCPTGRDSCAGGGVDPIHNYMDYSDDACYTEFSAGQQTRAINMFNQYRAQG